MTEPVRFANGEYPADLLEVLSPPSHPQTKIHHITNSRENAPWKN